MIDLDAWDAARGAVRLALHAAIKEELLAGLPRARALLEPLRERNYRVGILEPVDAQQFLDGVRLTMSLLPPSVHPHLVYGLMRAKGPGAEVDELRLTDCVVRAGRSSLSGDSGRPWCGVRKPDSLRLEVNSNDAAVERNRKLLAWWDETTAALQAVGWAARGGVWRPPT